MNLSFLKDYSSEIQKESECMDHFRRFTQALYSILPKLYEKKKKRKDENLEYKKKSKNINNNMLSASTLYSLYL